MRLAVIGRTEMLVNAARHLRELGHDIGLVMTTGEEAAVQPFADLAVECSADFINDRKINSEPVRSRLLASGCELGVSLNWITIVRRETVDCFKHGIVNAHGADLPRYRGNACANWAIMQGEPQVGLVVHRMTPELDAGPIYARELLPLSGTTYIGDVYDWIAQRVPHMYAKAIEMMNSGTEPTPQDGNPAAALRAYPRRPADSRILWHQGADAIHRLVRASSRPFAGAYCFLEDGRKVIVWRANVATPISQHLGMPGQPCEPVGADPMIACGVGFLQLSEIEVEGLSSDQAKAQINKSVRKRLV